MTGVKSKSCQCIYPFYLVNSRFDEILLMFVEPLPKTLKRDARGVLSGEVYANASDKVRLYFNHILCGLGVVFLLWTTNQ